MPTYNRRGQLRLHYRLVGGIGLRSGDRHRNRRAGRPGGRCRPHGVERDRTARGRNHSGLPGLAVAGRAAGTAGNPGTLFPRNAGFSYGSVLDIYSI